MSIELGSRPRSTRHGDSIGLAVTALAWAVATALVAVGLQGPSQVERITVDNPQPWLVNVDVTDADGGSWVGLGLVEGDNERPFHTILDQGDFWTFRFSYSGHHADLRLSRLELEQRDWQVTVPDVLADRLRAAEVPETPH